MIFLTVMDLKIQDDKSTAQNHSDFSIDHILNRAGNNTFTRNSERFEDQCDSSGGSPGIVSLDPLPWLQCTRYCPPRVPRTQRKEGPQKRQLGRHPRIPFTSQQLSILEDKFQQSPYLSSEEVIMLSRRLQLADIRVKIWFQNRRARERREKSTTPMPDRSSPNSLDLKRELCSVPTTTSKPVNFLLETTTSATHYISQVPFVHYLTNSNSTGEES